MLQKNFAMPFVKKSSRLTFRAEAFNLFNPTFDPRAIQLALRLAF